jgi:hypothetical protein
MKNSKNYILPFLFALLFASCGQSEKPRDKQGETKPKRVLVLVVENAGVDNEFYQGAINDFGFIIYPVLAEVMNVKLDDVYGKSYLEIMETVAEDFQLRQLSKAAEPGYDVVVHLSDELASFDSFRDTLIAFNRMECTIDVLFSLHADSVSVNFNDGPYRVDEMTREFKEKGISPRVLYQTCCTSQPHIRLWESIGVKGVNGARGINAITLFSPVYFLEEWIRGKSFEASVKKSYSREIEKLESYSNMLPVRSYILTEQNLSESEQFVGGTQPKIKNK